MPGYYYNLTYYKKEPIFDIQLDTIGRHIQLSLIMARARLAGDQIKQLTLTLLAVKQRKKMHDERKVELGSDPKENYNAFYGKFTGIVIGAFQMHVLEAIAELGKNAFGIRIRDYLLTKLEKEQLATPQVYAALSRLSDLGLVTSTIDEQATAGRKGRPRRVYMINSSGLRMLEAGRSFAKPTGERVHESEFPEAPGQAVPTP